MLYFAFVKKARVKKACFVRPVEVGRIGRRRPILWTGEINTYRINVYEIWSSTKSKQKKLQEMYERTKKSLLSNIYFICGNRKIVKRC